MGVWVYGKHGRRVTPDDDIGIRVPVEALISRADWDTIQRALTHRKSARRGRLPKEQDAYLLRGMLTCGHCGALLHTQPNSGVRYYRCGRHMPSEAKRYGKPTCDLPDVHAVDLETELWNVLTSTLLDPAYLTAGLEDARARHEEAGRIRTDRLAALDAKTERERARLRRLVNDLTDAGEGELRAAMLRTARDIERTIERFVAERAELAEVSSAGLSPEGVRAVEAFAADVRAGMDLATPNDRRTLYE